MLRTMQATIRENQLLAAGDEVLVALSGGPDSVALLEGLLQLSTSLSISISAAHLNHRLRGWESDEDERFVRSLAAKRGVRLIVEARDVKGVQRREGGSLEEVARRARYAFLREAAKRSGCKKIALGHNSEDNAETILMNLLRGSGLTGLSGIPSAPGGFKE
jgi:tRNA(Ile)-lysidine synthase